MFGTRTTRFSLLLLEEGEQYLQDWTAAAKWPEGFAKAHADSTEPGRLRLCSKSIFFEPDQAKLPVTRCFMEFQDNLKHELLSPASMGCSMSLCKVAASHPTICIFIQARKQHTTGKAVTDALCTGTA